ncbi:O-antigen ligase family protein [Patescibacteria group bacterium]|nr:O-antigen ligase family protein [Patescibacteria group bacterium]
MAETIILFIIILVFPFGQLARIDIDQINFPLIDLLVLFLSLANLITHLKQKKPPQNLPLLLFLAFTCLSFFINLYRYPLVSFKPLLYLLRLNAYLLLLIYPLQIEKIQITKFKKLFTLSLLTTLIFGLIQYFFWPDLTYFSSLNWDPHLFRLVSSFIDPTFTAIIFLLFFVKIYFWPKSKTKILLLSLVYLALALTYSRSALLSFLFISFVISRHQQKTKIFIFSLILVASTVFLLPRQAGEGTKLERSSSILAKIENYQEAIHVSLKAPLIGHGYNNLYFARKINIPQSHANFGFDNSFLTILATTGLFGLLLFLAGLKKFFRQSTFTQKIVLLAVFCHSLFANSLFYPWVIIFILIDQIS